MKITPYMRFRAANKGKGSFRAEGDVIWLYDVIASDREEADWWGGVAPEDFIDALAKTTGPVTLRINSPGGSVFGGQAMAAAMRAHAQPITARVDSLAASMASVLACEAATCEMADGAMMMIHKAWGVTVGNADDLRSTADLLDKIDGLIVQTYARRSATEADVLVDMMKAETWLTAPEAVAAGLADLVIVDNKQADHRAKWDLSAYAAPPGALSMPASTPKSAQPEADNIPDCATAKALRERRLQLALRAEPI